MIGLNSAIFSLSTMKYMLVGVSLFFSCDKSNSFFLVLNEILSLLKIYKSLKISFFMFSNSSSPKSISSKFSL